MASGKSFSRVHYVGEGILKVTGLQCTTISRVEDISIAEHTNVNVIAAVQSLTPPKVLNNSSSYIGGGSLFDAYCRTFCCDRLADRHSPPYGFFTSLQTSREALRWFLTHKPDSTLDLSIEILRYRSYVYFSCQGRLFFTTEEGYIGLAPKTTKAGDKVCVLLGCNKSLVFRLTENGKYKVVGECYICGLMDCEALLGPLPGHFEFVWRFDEEFGYNPAYIDRGTGETLVEDPRLGSLPAGWRRKSHKAELAWSWFVKEDDEVGVKEESEILARKRDPRLTLEALAARNVNLTIFELV